MYRSVFPRQLACPFGPKPAIGREADGRRKKKNPPWYFSVAAADEAGVRCARPSVFSFFFFSRDGRRFVHNNNILYNTSLFEIHSISAAAAAADVAAPRDGRGLPLAVPHQPPRGRSVYKYHPTGTAAQQ